MENRKKMILHLLVSIAVSFVFVYLLIFFGGWRWFESGDPIQMEFGVSVLVGFIFWVIFENTREMQAKIASLEERIKKLEGGVGKCSS